MAEGNAINVGSVEVDVVPTAKNIDAKIKAQTDPAAAKAGESAGGKFSDAFSKRLKAAAASLPDLPINADSSDADTKIAAIRAELKDLSDKRIGIDVDETQALAQLDNLQARLQEINADSASIQVKADTALASAELDKIKAAVDEIKAESATINVNADTAGADANMAATKEEASSLGRLRETININADTAGADAAIGALRTSLLTMGAISLAPLAGGLVALAGPLAAAGAGFAGMAAVAIPAVTDIKNALDAQKKAAGQVQAANTALANANDQVASAQRGVVNAQRTADQQAIQSAEAVQKARQSLSDAIRQQGIDQQNSAQAIADAEKQAAQQRVSAVQAVQSAEQSAAQNNVQALQQEHSAEEALQQAQISAKNAQQELTQARKDAADQLKQLAFQTADAQLSERSAQLQVEQAKQALDATNANKKSSQLQRQQAQLNYDQAVQQLKEQQYQAKQLAAQKADADKKGVKGADNVVKAQQNLAQANQDVADKQTALVQSQQNVVQVQLDGAKRVKQAQQNLIQVEQSGAESVAKAQRAAAQQQVRDAESVQNAQQGVADAMRSQANQQANSAAAMQSAQATLAKALRSQATAQQNADKANTTSKHALDQLTPSEKAVAEGYTSIKNAYKDWAKELGPTVLPDLTGGMKDLSDAMGLASPVIEGSAGALHDLEKKADGALKSKFWQQSAKFWGPESRKAVSGFGQALGDVATGLAGFLQGVSPLGNVVLGGLDQITGNFSKWGQNFAKNGPSKTILKSFQDLQQPMVHLFSSLGNLIGSVFKALLPLAVPVIKALTGASDALGPFVQQLGQALLPVFQDLAPLVKPLVQVLGSLLVGAVKALSIVLVPLLDYLGKHQNIFKVLTVAAVGFFLALKIATSTGLGVWSLAIAAIIIGIVELVQHWSAVKHVLITGWDAVANFFTKTLPGWFMAPIHFIEKHWRGIAQIMVGLMFGPVPALLWKYWGPISNWFMHLPGRVTSALKTLGSALASPFVAAFKWVAPYITKGISAIVKWFEALPGRMVTALKKTGAAISSPFVAAYKWAAPYITHGIDAIVSWFTNLPGRVSNGLHTLGSEIASPFKAAYKWSKGTITHGIDTIVGWFENLPGRLSRGLNSLGSKIASPFRAAFNWVINKVINPFIGLLDDIPGVSIKKLGTLGGGSKGGKGSANSFNTQKNLGNNRFVTAATGAVLPGYSPGHDTIPAMLSPGEGVLVPEAVRGLGPGFVHAANAHFGGSRVGGRKNPDNQHFLFGGIVKDIGKFGKFAASKVKNIDNAVDPLHIVNHVFDGAVGLAAKTANTLVNHMPFPAFFKSVGHGVVHAVQNAILHDGHADTKKAVGDGSGGGGSFISYAKQFLGQPYVWGGSSPGGFDCSGLTSYVMKHFGINAPRTASAQEAWAKPISQSAALPGDLVFYGGQVGKGGAHHVAFWDGNNKILEAQQSGVPLLIDAYRKGGLFGRAPGAGPFLGSGLLSGLFGGDTGKIAAGSKGQMQQYAKSLFGRHGWAANQLGSLINLWNGESGWNPNAQNPTSTAYGIAQFLNSTWKNYGPKTGNWKKQIEYGEDYIDDSYGTPSNAYSSWLGRNPHWYGSGLSGGIFTKPTIIGVGDGGPERVDVTPLHGPGAPSAGGQFSGNLYLSTGEFLGVVDGRIDSALDSVAKQVTHGRTN